MDALKPSPLTFTAERVRQILRDHYSSDPRTIPYFNIRGTAASARGRLAGTDLYHADEATRVQARQLSAQHTCQQYHSAGRDLRNHNVRLDLESSHLLQCHFPQYKTEAYPEYRSLTEDDIVEKTCKLLCRLPSIPLPLGNVTSSLIFRSISPEYLVQPDTPARWSNLKAVPYISTMVILLALLIISARTYHESWELISYEALREIPNTFIELLETSASLSTCATSAADAQAWMVVQSFLWASWQRYIMLFRWYVLGLHLQKGFDPQIMTAFSLRQYSDFKEPGEEIEQGLDSAHECPQYMCKWAFRLLQSDRSAVCQDFRRLCAVFEEAFPGRRPRCILNSTTVALQCDGLSVDNCQRFKGLKITDQSAHAHAPQLPARLCRPLFWDETSYRRVNGARAVCIDDDPADNRLKYCAASRDTLTISHVWSHGQGGRPEINGTGLNDCLHIRYCRIARQFECTSYWMDTPCIPQDHHLRAEAISYINEVFARSKMTLICDRDLMELEVEAGPNEVQSYESIVATMLVCDWNVRAWTLLESMRGRRHIYVLCKNDTVISVKKALDVVHQRGHIDLATLALTAQHMLPWLDRLSSSVPGYDPDLLPLGIPEATLLLVNRHASRSGDDVVIWTLLTGSQPFFDPKDFWVHIWRTLREVPTGYLFSDVPRLQHIPGLRWAPSQPRRANSVRAFRSSIPQHRPIPSLGQFYDGEGTRHGRVERGGAFAAVWQAFELVVCSIVHTAPSGDCSKSQQVLQDISQQSRLADSRILLLRPASYYPFSENHSVLYNGNGGGPLIAVLSYKTEGVWIWRGLYEWPLDVELPTFREQHLRIV
ncbi:hypothetical protein EPUS_07173 [Endocarpon pusillum Z07020]|uniref:Heterokaryon incompatibility domain-containing protein n=1 Tax=Endocarpon pusillum (strain Z07020 / HMAS-L-300199) TaxID=1263415 RepID=U1FUX6_ENDPU|nr:uncharacterized protein EPUS_07173 [Endocarpon pusillum Z07020]ERF68612.1 hypothetical protein EPUS_07173 [Endocarpon pusillum Z07020]